MGAEDRLGEAVVTPQHSCVVRAGILLTRESLEKVFFFFSRFGGGIW